jgi:hypothetical protein
MVFGSALSWAQVQESQTPGSVDDQSGVVSDGQNGGSSTGSGQEATGPPANPIPDWNRWSIEPPPESRSYLHGGVVTSESVGSQVGNSRGESSVSSISRVAGHLDFLNLNHNLQTAASYIAGADFTNYQGFYSALLQQLNATGRSLWSKGQFTVADSLGDFPGGNFGQTWFGGASAYQLGSSGYPGIANLAIAAFFGLEQFGGFGEGQHITNVALTELDENLTERSAITVAGGFAITTFPGSKHLLDSTQVSGLASYGYQLTRRSSAGLTYGYQSFQYPQSSAGNITVSLLQAYYSYVVSRRLEFSVGGGPEFVSTSSLVPLPHPFKGSFRERTNEIDPGVFAAVAYNSNKTILGASFNELVTAGSGFYAGSRSSVAELSASRSIKRWQGEFYAGYARLETIQENAAQLPVSSYQYGFVGVGVSRSFTAHWGFLASYQFNDESSLNTTCPNHSNCNAFGQRNSGLVGIFWQSNPLRLGLGSDQGTNADGSSN